MKVSYIKELDGLRGIAALMVMFFHFFIGLRTDNPFLPAINKISIFGQTGVSLFFVLSGFLITRILISTKKNKNYFLHFYLRRSLRIFPLYYLFLIIFYFFLPLIKGTTISPFSQQVYYWIYLQDFARTFKWPSSGPGHFWSLAIEEHFYLFWPFIVFYFNNRRIVSSIFLIIVVALITRAILIYHDYEVFYFTFSRMDELAIGALLAMLELNNKLAQTRRNAKNFLFAFLLIIIPTVLLWTIFTGKSNPSLQVTKFLLLGFAYFSLIGFIITANNKVYIKKILRVNFLLYTGRVSYGLYVYHLVCYWLVSHFFKPKSLLISLFLSFALSFITASLSYYLFEKKFLRLKKYFTYESHEKNIEGGYTNTSVNMAGTE